MEQVFDFNGRGRELNKCNCFAQKQVRLLGHYLGLSLFSFSSFDSFCPESLIFTSNLGVCLRNEAKKRTFSRPWWLMPSRPLPTFKSI